MYRKKEGKNLKKKRQDVSKFWRKKRIFENVENLNLEKCLINEETSHF